MHVAYWPAEPVLASDANLSKLIARVLEEGFDSLDRGENFQAEMTLRALVQRFESQFFF